MRPIFRLLSILVLILALSAAVVIHAQPVTPRAAPANDNFAGRITLTPRQLMGDNSPQIVSSAQDATIQSGSFEPVPSCSGGAFNFFHSIWYTFTISYELRLLAWTSDSTLDPVGGSSSNNTIIAIYSSSSGTPTLSSLSEVACNANGTNAGGFGYHPLPPGTYYLQLGSEVALDGPSTYRLGLGSRFQLLQTTEFNDPANPSTPLLAPWKVGGTGLTGDKVVCKILPIPREVRVNEDCVFRFKTEVGENSKLKQKVVGIDTLPPGATSYSEFFIDVNYFTERATTDATMTIKLKYANGEAEKDQRPLGGGATYVDPSTGEVPVKAILKINHTGTSGKPLYILSAYLYYAKGATGRDAVLPVPESPQ